MSKIRTYQPFTEICKPTIIETVLDKIELTRDILRDPRNKFGYQPNSLWIDEDYNYIEETHIWIWGIGPDGVHDNERDESFFIVE